MENKFLIIIFFVIALVILSILLKNKKIKGSLFSSLLYALLTGVLLSATGVLAYKPLVLLSYFHIYLIMAAWCLVLGILNAIFLRQLLSWAKEDKWGTEFFFSVFTALISSILMLVVFNYAELRFFVGIYLSTLFLYLLPYVFYGSLNRYLRIPVKVFRKWHYPVDEHVEDPNDREMESPLVVGFEFKKKRNDNSLTTFRAKAPKEMVFGKLFYYFINDYNDRNPDEKIDFLDENEKPVGWIFYFKPKFFGKRIRNRYILGCSR